MTERGEKISVYLIDVPKIIQEGGKDYGKEKGKDLYVPGMRRLPESKRVSFAEKRG